MKRLSILIVILMMGIALLFSGCLSTAPGTGEPSAKVTITNVSGYFWQTKGTGVELLRVNHGPYELTVRAAPELYGTVKIIQNGGTSIQLNEGEIVDILATPKPGFMFTEWTGPVYLEDSFSASTKITMPGHRALKIAHFKVIPGDTGPQGPQGEQGIQGDQGEDGDEGTDGSDGADGQDGADSQDGADGAIGATGPVGATGPAGQDLTLPDSIYVYYTIANTSNVGIQKYTIYFDASTDNGVYTGIATGFNLAIGEARNSYVKINVFSNEVTFIDYSLELQ